MTPAKALLAVQDAFFRGRYFLDPHALQRMAQRSITIHDIKGAVMKAKRAEPFSDSSRPLPTGVTGWRIEGTDFDGDELNVGVDLATDHLGAHVLVVTVF